MVFRRAAALVGVAVVVGCGARGDDEVTVMTASDALALPRPAADRRLAYGDDPLQFGELRLPEGEGPHPVVIVIHGGCWLAEYDLGYMSGLSDALTGGGVATWSVEYRRVGDAGGGWPGTFEDVAAAADHLELIASEYNLDLDRVAALGHSAGGHLALWLAGRHSLEYEDPFRGGDPVRLSGVVTLAGIPDLEAYAAPDGCGAAVPALLGGDPGGLPHRLRRSSPMVMAPLGVRQKLVTGELDSIVPGSQASTYAEVARRWGDPVDVIEIAGAGHFELVDPAHRAFATIRSSVLEVLGPVTGD